MWILLDSDGTARVSEIDFKVKQPRTASPTRLNSGFSGDRDDHHGRREAGVGTCTDIPQKY
jgi:hypothetical protein